MTLTKLCTLNLHQQQLCKFTASPSINILYQQRGDYYHINSKLVHGIPVS